MERELLNKLNLLRINFDPFNIEHLQDLLYVSYLNNKELKCQNSRINNLLLDMMINVFYIRKEKEENNNIDDLLLLFMSPRVLKELC